MLVLVWVWEYDIGSLPPMITYGSGMYGTSNYQQLLHYLKHQPCVLCAVGPENYTYICSLKVRLQHAKLDESLG